MLSALSAKVTLADGSELALNVPGSFGNNRGWKLTFDKLPAGATVTVDYTLTVERGAYVAGGGDPDSVVPFRNAFAVSTADGSTAEDSSTGKVKVHPRRIEEGRRLFEQIGGRESPDQLVCRRAPAADLRCRRAFKP